MGGLLNFCISKGSSTKSLFCKSFDTGIILSLWSAGKLLSTLIKWAVGIVTLSSTFVRGAIGVEGLNIIWPSSGINFFSTRGTAYFLNSYSFPSIVTLVPSLMLASFFNSG